MQCWFWNLVKFTWKACWGVIVTLFFYFDLLGIKGSLPAIASLWAQCRGPKRGTSWGGATKGVCTLNPVVAWGVWNRQWAGGDPWEPAPTAGCDLLSPWQECAPTELVQEFRFEDGVWIAWWGVCRVPFAGWSLEAQWLCQELPISVLEVLIVSSLLGSFGLNHST